MFGVRPITLEVAAIREFVNHRVCFHREIFFYIFRQIYNYPVVITIFARSMVNIASEKEYVTVAIA